MTGASHLKPVKGGKGGKAPPALPRQLEPVRRHAVDQLAADLASMLDNADDKLFDMADGASDEERDRCFGAMRELRLKRAGLESGFRQELERHFTTLARKGAKDGEVEGDFASQKIDIDNLTLVEDEDVEADVALENMARRCRSTCEEQLRAFNHRVEYIFEGRVDVDEKLSPLDPRQIASAFQTNLQSLDLNAQDRLILMKLFERGVLSEVGALITEANQALIDGGVLPDMKTPPIKRQRQPDRLSPDKERQKKEAIQQQEDPAGEGGGQGGGGGGENRPVFGMLQNLLGEMREHIGGPGAPLPGGEAPANVAVMHNGVPYVNGVPADADNVMAVPSDDLMGMLTRIQNLEQNLRREDGSLEEVNVRGELGGLLESEHGPEKVHAFDQADDDVINLVAMLFDFILDDEQLPAEIKALVGRLQIPLLKVAIADKEFFSNDEHPARVLLNLLAQAGSQWSPEQGLEDELYTRIKESVYTILNEFDTDSSLFRDLLEGMQSFLQDQEQRRDRVEERLREQEEGKARAEAAHKAVKAFIEKRMAGRELPEVVVRIIREAWEQVLYLTWIREGEDSELWKKRTKLLDATVWSVLPHTDAKSLIKLKSLSPRVLGGLKHGLEAVNHDPVESRKLLLALREEHRKLLQGENIERVEVEADDKSPPLEESEKLPGDHPSVKRAAELQPGQWLEIGLGDAARRCKLAANIRGGEKLIFINRRGLKVVEHSAQSLGVALEEGVARLIDEGALFDRALEAVIGDLRKHQSEQAARTH